jgi:hypothetical protein
MRCSYYHQSLVEVRGAIREIEVFLTGALNRYDQCNPWWVFARVNVWVCLLLSCVGVVSSLGQFGDRLSCLVIWGFLAVTGLTGVVHRPDRCRDT